MRTVDRRVVHATPEQIWPFAVQVERWPELLSHYRYVTRREGAAGSDGVVDMAAWRPFGALRWPTWWRSSMWIDADKQEIRYRHIKGITAGMDVLWTIAPLSNGQSDVTIVHEWTGPAWPLIGSAAANHVIGPVFVHGIASRTLAGLAAVAERAR